MLFCGGSGRWDKEGTSSIGQGRPQDHDGELRGFFSDIKLRLNLGR